MIRGETSVPDPNDAFNNRFRSRLRFACAIQPYSFVNGDLKLTRFSIEQRFTQ